MANSKSILNTRSAPKEIRNNTIRADQLVNYIKNDLQKYDKDLLSNQKRMKEIAQEWLAINRSEYHSIVDKYKENNYKSNELKSLITKVKNYRAEKSLLMNIPSYYVFTDAEMNEIVKVKPQKLEELKNILSPIKIKCHGEEILKIINNV